MSRTIKVTTPSRLHFGMFSFGRTDVRQFGGTGVMIDRPGVHLQITPAAKFGTIGPMAPRAAAVVDRLTDCWRLDAPPTCHIEILNAPPEHAGLGTGTQLELAVTAALNAFCGGEPLGPEDLARLSGRGARSAIGTYGFLQGGLLVEGGKLPGEPLSPLEHRIELPEDWRFVLVMLPGSGLAGAAERRAFGSLPPVPPDVTAALRAEVAEEMIPAALAGQFERFGESVYRFNREAGMCFAASQGGPYASKAIAELIERLRGEGTRGVGQTSWGPTIFALAESDLAATRLASLITRNLEPNSSCLVAEPSAGGAQIKLTTL